MQSHGWRCFRVASTLQLDQVGILAGLTHVLAAANVSVFALSTYDTDYVLVREEQLAQAVASLRGAGYEMSVSAGGEGPRATTKQDDP